MRAKPSVTATRMTEAALKIRRLGEQAALQRLEAEEPELASYLMEAATRVFAQLERSCPSYRRAKAIHRGAMLLTLTCVEALRRST